MNNELKYYYDLAVKNFIKRNNSYYFDYQNNSYIFTITDRSNEELIEIFEISNLLIQNQIFCHQIIRNNIGELITIINNKRYILMKQIIDSKEKISLNDIINFSIKTKNNWMASSLDRTNWSNLWINKLQNLEYQISQFGKNSQIYLHSFNYYAGLVENDIQLFNEIYVGDYSYTSICHKRLTYNTSLNEFYNPLNFVVDCAARDIAEYLKSKLIYNIDIYDEAKYCFMLPFYDEYEKKLMSIRLLFPSYQLDMYEKCFFDNNNLYNILNQIIENNNQYEKNIKKIYAMIITYIRTMPYINWLDSQ